MPSLFSTETWDPRSTLGHWSRGSRSLINLWLNGSEGSHLGQMQAWGGAREQTAQKPMPEENPN